MLNPIRLVRPVCARARRADSIGGLVNGMSSAEIDYRGSWQRLQALGLNAYEARSYMVLLGHPRFKALEIAARAEVPRQKIYEVLDSLLEKGFASVIQERTKMFSAVPPDQALPAYLARRKQAMEARSAAIVQARESASAMVSEARTRLEQDKQGAAASLQGEAEKLASEVIRTILKPAAAHSPTPAGGAR